MTKSVYFIYLKIIIITFCTFVFANFAQAQSLLKAVMHADLRIVDPILTTAHITRNHAFMVYDVLVAKNAKGEPRPQMADWKISENGLIYTFTLRDGLKFHDGAPVTSKDVVASLKRWGERDNGGQLIFDVTEKLIASYNKTIIWTLKSPFYPLLDILSKDSSGPAFIMPERIAKTPSSESITEYIGSGPFKFVVSEFKPGLGASYEKFADYVPRDEPADGMAGGKRVYIDRVEWITMPDEQTAFNALVNGEIDYVEGLSVDMLPLLKDNETVVFEKREPNGYQAMGRMNFKYPPFDNQKIRQAALNALSQQPILISQVALPEFYTLCGAVFGCGTSLASDIGTQDLVKNGNMAKAKALLKQAGYDGRPIIIMQPSVNIGNMAVVAAQNLREAGFNVKLEQMDVQTYFMRRAVMKSPEEGGWNMFFTSLLVPEIASPLSSPMLNGRGDAGWFGWPTDDKIEELKAKYILSKDDSERKAVAEEIQAHVIDFVDYIPLGEYQTPQGRSIKVINMLKTNVPVFWDMKKNN